MSDCTKLPEEFVIAQQDGLRQRSGEVVSRDPLTSFLYELLRDELPAGRVEQLVLSVQSERPDVRFTNGWLAKYAEDLAQRLRSAK